MGVNLWGASPLYVNPASVIFTFTQVPAEGKGRTTKVSLEDAGVQSDEPTVRFSLQSRVPGQVSTT